MTHEDLEQAFINIRQDYASLGFIVEASAPDKHARVVVSKFISDPPYTWYTVPKPYSVVRSESTIPAKIPGYTSDPMGAGKLPLRDKIRILVELEGQVLDKQEFATLDEVDAYLKQMGKSFADIHRLPW